MKFKVDTIDYGNKINFQVIIKNYYPYTKDKAEQKFEVMKFLQTFINSNFDKIEKALLTKKDIVIESFIH